MDRLETKKVWEEPRLVVHGDVEKITQTTDKAWGYSDGFTFQGISIRNAS
jgi:hypothetical protein